MRKLLKFCTVVFSVALVVPAVYFWAIILRHYLKGLNER